MNSTEQIPFDNEILSDDEAAWSCPYCGEEDCEPRDLYWSEFCGDQAHGGMVEYHEDRCTKCIHRA